jgi:hypothetical protein
VSLSCSSTMPRTNNQPAVQRSVHDCVVRCHLLDLVDGPQSTSLPDTSVLQCSTAPAYHAVSHPVHLLGACRLQHILQHSRHVLQEVVVHSPPCTAVQQAGLLAATVAYMPAGRNVSATESQVTSSC